MNNKQDKELVQLIQDVVDGKVQKKELCNKIYKEVYALSYPVYRDEAKSTTQAKKALIQVCNKINGIDLTKNIHKQIAVIVSTYFFVNAVDENSKELSEKTDIKEYNFSKIREDEEFLMYMKKKANAFRSPLVFDEEDEKLKSLDSVQMALVELYAYEMQSVDAIERMTDVDSSYIGSWIAQIKFILSGEAVALENTADEAKAAVANDNISNEIYEDAYENSDDDKEQYDESEEYSNEYDEQEAVSSVYQKRHRQHENAVTLFIRRLFPALSLPARMAMSWIAGCIVVIALVSVLFVSVIAGKNNKKKVNKDYDYRDMQYYTTKQSTTKQTGTTAESTTAGQTEEGNTTENNTAQTERRENTQEETQRETTRNNEESREHQEESSVEEQSTEQSTEEPTEGPTEGPTEEPTEGPTEGQTEQSTTAEQTTEEETTTEKKTTSDSDDDKQDRPISNENSDNN